ncbi:pilus assembly protein [Salmonella enterica]|nr:pilus assembly protein [Salmonella enterica]
MKKIISLIALIFSLYAIPSWALDCYQNSHGGASLVTTTLPSFAVPNNVAPGTKIWESDDLNVTVFCDNATHDNSDPNGVWKENIFMYVLDNFHITNQDVINNPYLAFGVRINGVDYDIPDMKLDTGVCIDQRSDMGKDNYPYKQCNGSTLVKSNTFSVRFRLYVKFKAMPPQGTTYSLPPITTLAFDGSGGINTLPTARNLHYNIDGLSNIHFLDCGVDIRIYPESQIVNFGMIPEDNFASQPATAPFNVSTIKDATSECTEQFDVTTSFYTDDTLYDSTHLDMDNGLIMRIIDKTAQKDVQFNKYQPFGSYMPGDASSITHQYIAELTRNPSRQLELGTFSKDLIVKVNYQ